MVAARAVDDMTNSYRGKVVGVDGLERLMRVSFSHIVLQKEKLVVFKAELAHFKEKVVRLDGYVCCCSQNI